MMSKVSIPILYQTNVVRGGFLSSKGRYLAELSGNCRIGIGFFVHRRSKSDRLRDESYTNSILKCFAQGRLVLKKIALPCEASSKF